MCKCNYKHVFDILYYYNGLDELPSNPVNIVFVAKFKRTVFIASAVVFLVLLLQMYSCCCGK